MKKTIITSLFAGACALPLTLTVIFLSCSADQKRDARTALDVSMCVQAVILDHLDEDLKDPVTAAQLGPDITARCYPKPVGDAGAP